MPRVKILQDYKPIEGWQPGDIIDITNPWTLVEQGKVALVDDAGELLERPGAINCPMSGCTFKAVTAHDFAEHIFVVHPKKQATIIPTVKKAPTPEATSARQEVATITDEVEREKETRRRRIEALEKARKIRMEKLAQHKQEVLQKIKVVK